MDAHKFLWFLVDNWLVGGLDYYLFFHILGMIIPTDQLIFFRGVGLNHQPGSIFSRIHELGCSFDLVIIEAAGEDLVEAMRLMGYTVVLRSGYNLIFKGQ